MRRVARTHCARHHPCPRVISPEGSIYMFARSYRLLPLLALGALAACGHDGTSPNSGLDVGQSLKLTGAQDVKLEGGSGGANYFVVLTNTGTTAGVQQSYTLTGNGLGGSVAALVPQD